jgi:hypothetical protein
MRAILFTLLLTLAMVSSTCHAQLLFKSGFESGVTLTPYFPENTIWRRNITGTDSTTGFTWPGDLPGERTPIFQFVLGKEARFEDFVATKIETVPGRDGKPTKAMFFEVINDDPDFVSLTRVEYMYWPPPEHDQCYVKYWMKLQEDFLDVIGTTDKPVWRLFMECKEPKRLPGKQNYDYRWNLHIYKDGDTGKPYFVINAEQGNPEHIRHFDIRNKDVPVPIGEWFKVEYFWKHHVSNGRFWLKINDVLIGDHKGRLSHPDGHNKTAAFHSFMKLYVGRGWFHGGNTARAWIDDIEIRTDPPKN